MDENMVESHENAILKKHCRSLRPFKRYKEIAEVLLGAIIHHDYLVVDIPSGVAVRAYYKDNKYILAVNRAFGKEFYICEANQV